MIRKLFIIGLVGFCAIVALKNTKFGGYVGVYSDRWGSAAEKKIPLDIQLERIEKELTKLDQDIRSARSAVAEATVSNREIKQELQDAQAALPKLEVRINELTDKLKKEETAAVAAGKPIGLEEGKARLKAEVALYNQRAAEVASLTKRAEFAARRQAVAERKLAGLLEQKADLGKRLTELKLKLEELKAEQIESKNPVEGDPSRLNDIKESMKRLEHRIEVEREKMRLDNAEQGKAGSESVDDIRAMLKKPGESVKIED